MVLLWKYKRKNYYNNHILNCRIHKICKNPPKIYNIPIQTQPEKSTIIHHTTQTDKKNDSEIVRENQGETQGVTDVDSIEFDKMTITNENLFKLLINLTNKYEKLQNDYNENFEIHIAPGNHEIDGSVRMSIFEKSRFISSSLFRPILVALMIISNSGIIPQSTTFRSL